MLLVAYTSVKMRKRRGEGERRGRREEGKERRVHRQITGEASFLIWISSFPEWSRNVAKLRELASPICPLPNLS